MSAATHMMERSWSAWLGDGAVSRVGDSSEQLQMGSNPTASQRAVAVVVTSRRMNSVAERKDRRVGVEMIHTAVEVLSGRVGVSGDVRKR